jgi:hypothetical protein
MLLKSSKKKLINHPEDNRAFERIWLQVQGKKREQQWFSLPLH